MFNTFARSIGKHRLGFVALALLIAATPLLAQTGGQTTGNITGTVTISGGSGIPGVTVTATSPALLGSRTAYTGDNGDYILRGLSPGRYSVKFELSGMAANEQNVQVDLGGSARLDVQMSPTVAAETIDVVATAPTALTTTQLGNNVKQETINRLPIARNLSQAALLAPSVTPTGFNAGQVRIAGATAFDNVFMVDGTDISDNLFGTPNNLTIEDSIAETQVITGGVSAEYGRFTGGIVNAITKSGGNEFSGTARADFTNSNWSEKNPWQEGGVFNAAGQERAKFTQMTVSVRDPRNGAAIQDTVGGVASARTLCAATTTPTTFTDKVNHVLSATLGGPVLRDRLWFFGAYRNVETETTGVLTENPVNFAQTNENPRYELKLTGNIASNHSIQGSFLRNEQTRTNVISLGGQIDESTLINRDDPQERWAIYYNGILTSNLFTEVKYSEKTAEINGAGGTETAIVRSPFLNRTGAQRVYNAPYFDANDPEARNNEDLTATLSYFLSSKTMGSHDLKGGVENYKSYRVGGNSQSATSYVFLVNPKRDAAGNLLRDTQGRLIPVFQNFTTSPGAFAVINNWQAERGSNVGITTRSFFLNDTWNFNKNFSFNLGVRHEIVDGKATGGVETVDTTATVPRLGMSYDVLGNGRTKVDLTYGHYAGKYNERQFGQNQVSGNPALVQYAYAGPDGEGFDFAPAFNLANYQVIFARFPTANVIADDNLASPLVKEWTLGVGQALGKWGFAKVTYIRRDWTDFVDDFISVENGRKVVQVTPTFSTSADIIRIGNQSELEKEYESVTLLSQINPLRNTSLQLVYTHELRNHGNYVGEAANQPGNNTLAGDYPGFYNEERHFPTGALPGFQKHRVKLLGTYALELGRVGTFDIGGVYTYNSGLPFSLAAAGVGRTAAQNTIAAQYVTPPTSQTVFFDERGSEFLPSEQSFDLSLTYSLPIWKTLAPWVKFDVFNVFDSTDLLAYNTDLVAITGATAPVDSLGLPTTYNLGANYGRATSSASFQAARSWQVSAGLRF